MAKRSVQPSKRRPRGKRRRHEIDGSSGEAPPTAANGTSHEPQPPAAKKRHTQRLPPAPLIASWPHASPSPDALPAGAASIAALPDAVRNAACEMRLARLTEVQRRCWASVRDGRDVVGVAPTGSGKTLAYMLPLAAALANPQRSGASPAAVRSGAPRALVLTPTRELAQQVASVGERVFSAAGAGRVCAVHGGTVRAEQRAAVLSAPPIALLVGTPGRVLDLAGASSSAAAAATAAAGGGGCSAGSSSAGSSSAADGKSSCRTATVSYSGDATAASAPASLCLHAVRWLILDEADKLLLSSDLQSQVGSVATASSQPSNQAVTAHLAPTRRHGNGPVGQWT